MAKSLKERAVGAGSGNRYIRPDQFEAIPVRYAPRLRLSKHLLDGLKQRAARGEIVLGSVDAPRGDDEIIFPRRHVAKAIRWPRGQSPLIAFDEKLHGVYSMRKQADDQ
jgi:hypothetical protein